MSVYDIRRIISEGGSAIVDAEDYSSSDLRNMVSGKDATGKLIIRNPGKLSSSARSSITRENPESVIFDYTNCINCTN